MFKTYFILGAVFIMIGIIAGAFGAHALSDLVDEGTLTPEKLRSFETGARYAIYGGIFLILCGFLDYQNIVQMKLTATMITIGVLLFSGSIFLLSLNTILGIESFSKFLGPITPLGGFLLITAWIPFIYRISKKR